MNPVRRVRHVALVVSLSVFGIAAPCFAAPEEGARTAPLRILFIGNSRIYYHNQPAMLQALAEANQKVIETEILAAGGATLSDHWESGEAHRLLRSERWDHVVVNEQSTWGRTLLVAGVARVPMAPESFTEVVAHYAEACAAHGAKLVLLLHPARRNAPPADWSNLEKSFASAQRSSGASVAPVGLAIRRAEAAGLIAYDADGNHPSALGALVSASTIYATLFGEAPSHVPQRIRGAKIDEADGSIDTDTQVTLVEVSADLQAAVSAIASDAVAEWRYESVAPGSETGSMDLELPRLPEPDAEITGRVVHGPWSGTLDLYPRWIEAWPARMKLMIHEEGGRLVGRLELRFGGAPDDIVYRSIPISNEGSYLQFIDPDGPNGGYVRYRVVPSRGELRGIGEFMTDRDVYGIGELRLRREP